MGRAEDEYLLGGEAVHLEDENIGGADNEVADGRLIFDQSQGMLQSLAGYQLTTIYILAMNSMKRMAYGGRNRRSLCVP